jgi:anti-sigma regulatory factor (Ser/Thr protein kinase)
VNAILTSSEQEQVQVSTAPLMALISLPRTGPAVGAARRWLTETLTAWGVNGDQLDDAVLLLSEVFTNSVVHAIGGENATVTAALWQGHLRITVSDPDPEVHASGDDDEHGRGMLVVRELSTRHGITRTANGKVVWFEMLLTTPGAATEQVAGGASS